MATDDDDPARALPPPSDAAWDFIARAASNPHFRRMIERLARVPLRGWVTPDLTPAQAHDIAAHAPRLDVERHLVWCYEQIDRLRAELAAREEIVRAVADGTIGDTGYCDYGYCRCDPDWVDDPDDPDGGDSVLRHQPDCLIAKARALLAADSEH